MLFQGLDYYDKFKEAFMPGDLNPDREGTALTEEIFYTLSRIRLANWKHKLRFNRSMNSETSSLFQDIVALYLKSIYRYPDFEVNIEKYHQIIGRNGIRPDIEICYKKEDNYEVFFIVEIKTTMGWTRDRNVEDNNTRLALLKEQLNLEDSDIAFIIEATQNCDRRILDAFWRNNDPVRPGDPSFARMFPFFRRIANPDSSGIEHPDDISDIHLKLPENHIHSSFESILKEIDNALEKRKNKHI